MKNSVLVLILAIICVFCFVGCNVASNSANGNYSIDYATDAHQYCMIASKQIDVVVNQLSANIIIAKDVAANEYPIEDALKTAKQSLSMIQSAKAEFEKINPPEKYKDSSEHTISLMQDAENDMQTFINELSQQTLRPKTMQSLASIMQIDFVALTSEFNVYYE